MKLIRIWLLMIVQTALLSISAFAQKADTLDIWESDFHIDLPPLSVLIDSAYATNPQVNARDVEVKIQRHNLKTDRNYWLRNFGMQTDVRYGTFDHFTTNTLEGEVPTSSAITSSEFRYGVGAYVKLPLMDIVNRRNSKIIGNLEVQKAEWNVEMQREEIRQKVIRQYNDLVLKLRLLKIKTREIETARINMQMSEKEFVNGIIPVTEYARLTEISVSVELGYETAKMELITSLMLLEDMCGVKLKVH